jgi:hypothetical protein
MLSETSWRTEALVRLLLGVLVCVFLGGLMACLLRLGRADTGAHPLAAVAVVMAGFAALGTALVLTRKPWQIEESRRRLMLFLASLYMGLALMAAAQRLIPANPGPPDLGQMVVAGISFQGAALVLVGLFLREHGLSWSAAFGFGERRGRAVGWGLLAALAVLPVAWLLQMCIAALLTRLNVGADAQVAVQVLREAPEWTDRLPLGFIAICIAPPAEEALFRGLIYPTFKRTGSPRLALWGTALLFAAIHWNLASFLPLVLLALVLTWLYERTGNLLAPIAAHSLFNAMNFLALQLFDRLWTASS